MPSPLNSTEVIHEWRIAMIDLFVSASQLIGLPKSVGQIYGYLYSAVEPAPMDQIISELGISKGSASQGLKFLRQLGAAKTQFVIGDRRDHFVAEVKSKKLIGGFIREKLTPALEEGAGRIAYIRELAPDPTIEKEKQEAMINKLESWQNKLGLALPLLQKILGD